MTTDEPADGPQQPGVSGPAEDRIGPAAAPATAQVVDASAAAVSPSAPAPARLQQPTAPGVHPLVREDTLLLGGRRRPPPPPNEQGAQGDPDESATGAHSAGGGAARAGRERATAASTTAGATVDADADDAVVTGGGGPSVGTAGLDEGSQEGIEEGGRLAGALPGGSTADGLEVVVPLGPADDGRGEPASILPGIGASEPRPSNAQPSVASASALTAKPPAARPRWARALAVLLVAGLGLGISVSVRSNSGPAGLANARQEDLVRILDQLDAEGERLRGELGELERTRAELAGGDGPAAALQEARERALGLAVLAGTVPAQGPGIEIIVNDPQSEVDAAVLIDALQELRDAGAEAIEINGLRAVVSTYILDSPAGGLVVDGTTVVPPYRLAVIGDSHTLAQAMQIPGGVLDTVASRSGADATIESRERIEIRALRPLPTHRYARPAG